MSDHTWWTPARYGRQTPNGITCQSCGHDVCQCSPRTATIGEHVDAVLAAKDAEIERLRQFLARANADHDRACDALAAATRERDEWRASAAGYGTDAEQYKHERDEARAEVERLNASLDEVCDLRVRLARERDEARALLREVLEWHRCPWKHGASVEVIDLQLHAAWIARLDAALGGPR